MNVACFLVAQVSLLQQFRPQLEEGKAVVFIFFANLEVAHEEERLLLDFPALVHIIFAFEKKLPSISMQIAMQEGDKF